ncbi:hypothetical protein [Novosphingobium sp.]|nr:hypothetical protein [Novosphingobium sp.]
MVETVGMTHGYEAVHSSHTGAQVWNFMLRDRWKPGNASWR